MTAFDDRQAAETMAETFGADERETVEGLNRSMRLRDGPPSLRVNCPTGDAISPSGVFNDEDVARLERIRREALERYRSD